MPIYILTLQLSSYSDSMKSAIRAADDSSRRSSGDLAQISAISARMTGERRERRCYFAEIHPAMGGSNEIVIRNVRFVFRAFSSRRQRGGKQA
jgi:hypothetical protein